MGKTKTENKGKALECNHLGMRNTIMSFFDVPVAASEIIECVGQMACADKGM